MINYHKWKNIDTFVGFQMIYYLSKTAMTLFASFLQVLAYILASLWDFQLRITFFNGEKLFEGLLGGKKNYILIFNK